MRQLAYGLIAVPLVAGVFVASGIVFEYYYCGDMRVAARIVRIRIVQVWLRYEGWTLQRRLTRLKRVEKRVSRWTEML
ncbi:hypothetical protein [Kozakia baliensis]|uniref:Uncharacterized protein n=1 Tax=Kozakia baliensis TaxID=153496 RepID=A0A1D8UTG4_9PROT|nr:hypothetical protein [Kozakia baliensis]AOX16938.1 hypothetical protein A0U89_07070 [Kozakia baliensis]GBR25532.1 hypothetical protein AA0488_0672 [Kozakia baliensis NRIC 0488]GEL64015.1 hypothetical protein KBA01_13010 [Kozakia baliensis]